MLRLILIIFALFNSFEVFAHNNSIVAIVDGNPITKKEFEDSKRLDQYLLAMQKQNVYLDDKSILKQLINQTVIIEKGKTFGFVVTEDEITNYIDRLEVANKMKKGQLRESLQRNNLLAVFRLKIRSNIILDKVAAELWKSQTKSSKSDIYNLILDANNQQTIFVKYRVYSSKDLNDSFFKNLMKLKDKIDCNYIKKLPASINFVEDEAVLSSLDTGMRVLLSDAKENVPTNIIRTKDNYNMYLVCGKTFPPISVREENNIKNYIDMQTMQIKLGKIVEQWQDNSSITILN